MVDAVVARGNEQFPSRYWMCTTLAAGALGSVRRKTPGAVSNRCKSSAALSAEGLLDAPVA